MKKVLGAPGVKFAAALLILAGSGWFLSGRAANPRQGFPTDWSHRHLIFSRVVDPLRAARIEADPRYWQQFARRNVTRVLSTARYGHPGLNALGIANFLNTSTVNGDWSENLGSGASLGAGNFPAKYSFDTTTANCGNAAKPDYVVFPTGLVGSSSQASIVAFDNLYSGCTGSVPQTYWAYNTNGQILTSPVVSLDGTQVAFAQTVGGQGNVILLKWKASTGTVGAPVTLVPVSNSAYRSCTAPCMTTITLRTGAGTAVDDTTSSVIPDYTNDLLYVGGTLSWLHKIKGVFQGTPGEVATGGFPAQVFPGNPTALSSPTLDLVNGNIIVGDYGGYLHRVNATTGVAVRSGQLDFANGVIDTVVDPSVGLIYAFASKDNSTGCGGAACSAVYFLSETFAANTTGTKVNVGRAAATATVLYEGDFDNAYLNSTNATGKMYVCGNSAGGGVPTLYQIPITNGVPGTVLTGPALSSVSTGCSATTVISNPNVAGGTNEWVFAGVRASGLGNSCASGGCVMNFVTQPWQPSQAYTVGQEVLDNGFRIQTVRTAGTSGTTTPAWNTTIGGTTNDGAVLRWRNQGPQTPTHASWIANHAYALRAEILDPNGNIQEAFNSGTSAGTQPNWNTTAMGTTTDGGVMWRNLGPVATSSIAAAGGSSGIILDNVTSAATRAGASQVYFSTLGNQNCATSGGTGGCAIQASQSSLK